MSEQDSRDPGAGSSKEEKSQAEHKKEMSSPDSQDPVAGPSQEKQIFAQRRRWEPVAGPSRVLDAAGNVRKRNVLPTLLNRHDILRKHRDKLTPLEKAELQTTEEIYCFGENAIKLLQTDDHQGHYNVMRQDHINYRFEINALIKQGEFASVVNAYDMKNQENVAVKIFKQDMRMELYSRHEYLKYTELQSREGRGSAFIVKYIEHFLFRFHYCLTFELLDYDLANLLEMQPRGISTKIIKNIVRSVLEGLAFLHANDLIHRDLKPSHIAFVPNTNLEKCKLLGIGRSLYTKEAKGYPFVQTLPYRAPEVIMRAPYDTKIDIFSVGIIALELETGSKFFYSQNVVHMMYNYVEVFGIPLPSALTISQGAEEFFIPNHMTFVDVPGRSKCQPRSKPLGGMLRQNDPNFVNFIEDCCYMTPHVRPTAELLLKHHWLAK